MDVYDLLNNLGRLHQQLSEDYGYTHVGSYGGYDKPVVWGLIYPRPEIHVYGDDGFFEPVVREQWEKMTQYGPPWPWNEQGTGLDFRISKDTCVSVNETWPRCPRCMTRLDDDGWDPFVAEDHEEGRCNTCGQLVRIGNVFSFYGTKEAREISEPDFPGFDGPR